MDNSIQILSSNNIDSDKWNKCIEESSNPLIYATYLYLSGLCDQWSGLVIGDYKTVMPLPWRKKWGITYLYVPAFIQQLGVFGELYNLPWQQMFLKIKEFSKYGDLLFNYNNTAFLQELKINARTNFVLNLNQPYPAIKARYTHDLIKNLQKAEKRNLKYSNKISIEYAISKFKDQYQNRIPQYKNQHFTNLNSTCLVLAKNNQCILRSVFTEESIDPISIALLLKYKNRIYLLLNSTDETGRAYAANHFLLDQIIQEFCEEELVLDFEGSEKKGIKEFYESFRPENEPYFQYSYNVLPSFINFGRKLLSYMK